MTTEAEAIARLREVVAKTEREGHMFVYGAQRIDLRALLDAHAKLEAAHAEALHLLQEGAGVILMTTRATPLTTGHLNRVTAVLAKAGHRE